ncbi:hypothetical protein GCM10029992_03440 [Glycomyces albus]
MGRVPRPRRSRHESQGRPDLAALPLGLHLRAPPRSRRLPGIERDQPADGCCLHGAFYTDADDIRRVKRAAAKLTPETWQLHRRFKDTLVDDTLENDDGEEEPAKKTAVVDGACVFHNRDGFGTGPGCALHQQAMRDGVHPMEYKPEVCWQLPVKRDFTTEHRADGTDVDVTLITEFDRASWGPGGHDFDWWCTGSRWRTPPPNRSTSPTPPN